MHYGDYTALKQAFVEFVQRVPFYGLAVLCLDHPAVQGLLPSIERRHVTYGMSPQADYAAGHVIYEGLTTRFEVSCRGRSLGEFAVNMPGRHNVLNCLATIAIADELAVPLDVMKQSLATFHGVARRFTIVGQPGGVTLVDDYGHHPAEIEATLEAARNAYDGRILVAFQPHRYSRTESLFDDFARAFNKADRLLVTDIYAAGEQPIANITSEALVQRMIRYGHHAAEYVADRPSLVQCLAREAKPGDLVISLGAGDINRILADVAVAIEANQAGGKPA